jgi:hypothetical protein
MRVLAILALALTLAGCTGDRIKQGMNLRQAQPPSAVAWLPYTSAERIRV